MKKIITTSILVVALSAGMAFAYGHGWGMRGQGSGWGDCYSQGAGGCGGPGYGKRGAGRGMMGGFQGNVNCPRGFQGGQSGWNGEQQQKFLDETLDLRKEMNTKRFELREARRNPNTTPEQLGTLEKEMIDLQTKLNAKALELQAPAQ